MAIIYRVFDKKNYEANISGVLLGEILEVKYEDENSVAGCIWEKCFKVSF